MSTEDKKRKDPQLWRDLVAYWMLGLCNNYGYIVMLTAAHDIISEFNSNDKKSAHNDNENSEQRHCNILSTGAILLADILPALFVKIIIPFVPFWVDTRTAVAIICAAAGFLLVAFQNENWIAILGVVVTSASCGIGETTFLAYSSNFNKNVISTWSSGTGGAGVIGSLSYVALRSLNLSPRDTMLVMLTVPVLESISFWILLRRPSQLPFNYLEATEETIKDEQPITNFVDKLIYIQKILKYLVPLTMIYFFQYLINHGLYELVYFENIFIDLPAQYRWYIVDYRIGILIARSTVNLIHFKRIWLMTVFQFINFVYFITESLLFYTSSIWIVYAIVFWEGLLGGSAYVNTYYKMSYEVSPEHRQFAISLVSQSDVYGITAAGFLAMPVHNAICALPAVKRSVVW